MAGRLTSTNSITLQDCVFDELHPHRTKDSITLRVFDAKCRYDVILGRDILLQLGFWINFEAKLTEWDDTVVAMRLAQDLLSPTEMTHTLLATANEETLFYNDGPAFLVPELPSPEDVYKSEYLFQWQ